MSPRTPLVSIVVPTRDRAVLLRHALDTALAQTAEDIEVVVFDNASGDDTPRLLEAIDDPRLRTFRSDRALPAHESWERALERARGTWLTVLPDDDGLVPTAVERVVPLLDGRARAVAWRECWYAHPELPAPWLQPAEINRVVVEPWSGRVEELDARAELGRIFRRRERRPAPGLVGSLVHRDTLARVRAETGRVFGPPDPFLVACAAVMALEPTYLVLDLPLSVRGVSAATISANLQRNTGDAHAVVSEYAATDLFREVPLRARTTANLIAESLLRAKRSLAGHLDGIDHDVAAYFVASRLELADRRRRDDGGAGLHEWHAALAQQPASVRARVWRHLAWRHTSDWSRRAARRVPAARRARGVVRRHVERRSEVLLLQGDECGFHDLPGAARHVDSAVLPTRERVVPNRSQGGSPEPGGAANAGASTGGRARRRPAADRGRA